MRTLVKLSGLVLVGLALAFVGIQIAAYVDEIRRMAATPATWGAIAVSAALYGGLSLLLALAWYAILGGLSPTGRVTFSDSYEVYGRSQIAKYVPGNVFHFFGRQLLGRDKGWGQGAIAVASVVETLVLGSSAAALVLLASFLSPSVLFDVIPPLVLAFGAGLAVAVPIILLRFGAHWPALRRLPLIGDAQILARGPAVPLAFLIHVVFFLATSLIFWFLINALAGAAPASAIPSVVAAFVSGWLLGNMTPSAPGGIGVREAVMLPQLAASIGEPQAVVIVIMFRIVTIGGDVLFFLAATALAARQSKGPAR
jgi:glycosyltransferase 2 family protein